MASLVDKFDISGSFEENATTFYEVYRHCRKTGWHLQHVNGAALCEQMKKTQYHMFTLFFFAHEYNRYVRKYNDLPGSPEWQNDGRYKPFIHDNLWYNGPESVTLVGVAGPGCSGKTSACSFVHERTGAVVIGLDNFT